MSESTKFIEVVSLLVAMAGVFLAADDQIDKFRRDVKSTEERKERTAPDLEPPKPAVKPKYQERYAPAYQDRYAPAGTEPGRKPHRGYLHPRTDWYEPPCDEW